MIICKVDYTFESIVNDTKSTIDHFVVSEYVVDFITNIGVNHDIDNLSDHSVISTEMKTSVNRIYTDITHKSKLLWAKATDNDIDHYRQALDTALDNIELNKNALYCKDVMCDKHCDLLQVLHDDIIRCSIDASRCIPSSRKPAKGSTPDSIPGWKEFI
jgi:hypothetical protein